MVVGQRERKSAVLPSGSHPHRRCPRPGLAGRRTPGPHPPADLTEIVRLYGLRPWIEQSYKQIKDELGWADVQVGSDTATRHHQPLVNCAFSFCWDQCFSPPGPLDATAPVPCPDDRPERGATTPPPVPTSLLVQGITRSPLLGHPRWWQAWTDTDGGTESPRGGGGGVEMRPAPPPHGTGQLCREDAVEAEHDACVPAPNGGRNTAPGMFRYVWSARSRLPPRKLTARWAPWGTW